MAYYDNEYIDDCSGVSQPHAMRGCCFNANIGTCRHSDDKGNRAHATQQRTQRGQSRCSIPGTWLHVITQPRHTCCKQESGAMPAAQRAPCWRQTRRGCYCQPLSGLGDAGSKPVPAPRFDGAAPVVVPASASDVGVAAASGADGASATLAAAAAALARVRRLATSVRVRYTKCVSPYALNWRSMGRSSFTAANTLAMEKVPAACRSSRSVLQRGG